MSGHVTWTKSEVEILNEKQYIGGEFDPFPETDSGSVLTGDWDEKSGDLRMVGIPVERNSRKETKNYKEYLLRKHHGSHL